LMEALFGKEYKTRKLKVNATLEGGATEQLDCIIDYAELTPNMDFAGYFGEIGSYTVDVHLAYPVGYKSDNTFPFSTDLTLQLPVQVTTQQSARYQNLWVTQRPNLTYQLGDTLNLSNIQLRVRDTTYNDSNMTSDHYITYAQFAEYGIEFRLDYPDGDVITGSEVVSATNAEKNVYVYNTKNGSSALVGRIMINEFPITGFNPISISNGAVGSTYYLTADDVKYELPMTVTSTNGIGIPVTEWNIDPSEDLTNYGNVAAVYTYIGTLGDAPIGYTLGNITTVTAEVTVHASLEVSSIDAIEPIHVPQDITEKIFYLPRSISVTLSDGRHCEEFLAVSWDASGVIMDVPGTYTITGTVISSDRPNIHYSLPNQPSITVNVTHDTNAAMLGLEVVTGPDKLFYQVGDTLDTTGITFAGVYADGSRVNVVSGSAITLADTDLSSPGIKHVTVNYDDNASSVHLTANFAVYVKDPMVADNVTLFVNDSNQIVVVTGSAITLPETPIKQGSFCDGWYMHRYGDGAKLMDGSSSYDGMIAYAYWQELRAIYDGTRRYSSGIYYVYEIFKNGFLEGLSVLQDADPLTKFIFEERLYIDIYSVPTGLSTYNVTDKNGNGYEITLNQDPLPTLTANYYGKNGGMEEFSLGVPFGNTTFVDFSSYDASAYTFERDGMLYLALAANSTPQTYRFVVGIDGTYYKLTIVR